MFGENCSCRNVFNIVQLFSGHCSESEEKGVVLDRRIIEMVPVSVPQWRVFWRVKQKSIGSISPHVWKIPVLLNLWLTVMATVLAIAVHKRTNNETSLGVFTAATVVVLLCPLSLVWLKLAARCTKPSNAISKQSRPPPLDGGSSGLPKQKLRTAVGVLCPSEKHSSPRCKVVMTVVCVLVMLVVLFLLLLLRPPPLEGGSSGLPKQTSRTAVGVLCPSEKHSSPRCKVVMTAVCVLVILVVLFLLLLLAGDVERNPGPTIVTVDRVDQLAALLSEEAADWELLLGQLGVPQATRDQIKLETVGSPRQSKLCLAKGLRDWATTNANPTYENIIEVLDGNFVSNRPLARKIEVFLQQLEDIPPSKRCRLTSHSEKVQRESSDDEFCDACEVQLDETEAIILYKKYLQEYYKAQTMAPAEDTKWPPTPSIHYINLAYISKMGTTRQQAYEFTKSTIEGDIDEILREKEPMKMENIAKLQSDGSYPKLVLVEGAPGVGKTTFSWELCRRWAEGELLQHYSLVVVLRCRDKRVREAKTIDDLFVYRKKDSVLQDIDTNLGKGVLFIVEGYDELPEHLRQRDSIFSDLISGRLLPCATVLVTSRPSATGNLKYEQRQHMTQHIEILGFTKEQVQLFLQSVVTKKNDFAILEQYLELHPQIHAAMYIPLNAAIVVLVYQESEGGELPETMTELYKSLTKSILIRFLYGASDGHKRSRLRDFSDLPIDTHEKFLKLCKLAYDGIRTNQQLIFSDLPEDFETLGIMQSVTELYVDQGESVSYNFLHLTIQEFLAAFHIFIKLKYKWTEHFEKYRNDSHFTVTLRFLAGLTKLESVPLCTLLDVSKKDDDCHPRLRKDYLITEWNFKLSLDIVHWLFEAHNPTAIEQSLKVIFDIHSCEMPLDYYTLGYCIRSYFSWHFDIDEWSEVDSPCMELLTLGYNAGYSKGCGVVSLSGSQTHPCSYELKYVFGLFSQQIQQLELTSKYNSHPEYVYEYTPSLHNLCNLQALMVSREWFIVSRSRIIKSLQSHPSLKYLEIQYLMNMEQCQALSVVISSTQSLEALKIDTCFGNDYGTQEVLDAVYKTNTLKHLDIAVKLSPSSITCLASILSQNQPPLTGLYLEHCDINTQGAVEMFQLLSDTSNITRLDLSYNPIGEGVIVLVRKIAQGSLHLTELYLSHCGIGEHGAVELVQALCSVECQTISTLDLSHNPVGAAATYLARLRSSTLIELRLYDCAISPQGGAEIAQALCSNTTLKKLDMSWNKLNMDILAIILQHNSSLTHLKVRFCKVQIQDPEQLLKLVCSNTNSKLEVLHVKNNPVTSDVPEDVFRSYKPKSLKQLEYAFKDDQEQTTKWYIITWRNQVFDGKTLKFTQR